MFHPSFCPNPACYYHTPTAQNSRSRPLPFVRIGSYYNQVVGLVLRYRCTAFRGYTQGSMK